MTSSITDPAADARVRSLGYLRVDATDLDAWAGYGSGLLGLQVAHRTDDLVESGWTRKNTVSRFARRTRTCLTAVGWEVGRPQELDAIVTRLADSGYRSISSPRVNARSGEYRAAPGSVTRTTCSTSSCTTRCVSRSWRSPRRTGQKSSPGAGLGHVFQFWRTRRSTITCTSTCSGSP